MDAIVNFFHNAVGYIQAIPGSTWAAFFALLTSGVVVSMLVEMLKHRLNTKREQKIAKSVVGFMVTAFASIITIAQSIMVYGALNPNFLGMHTTQVVAFAYSVYLFGGSKVYKAIGQFLAHFQAAWDATKPAPVVKVVEPTPPLAEDPQDGLLS